MTLLQPVYRATVYAPKSTDATEATVLTPIVGAAHSDPFKVTTAEGVSGFKSYMNMPNGRRGRVDLLAKKTDIGELNFEVQDQRTTPGGSNAQRWVTAFVGDNKGLVRFARLKCFIEESLYGIIVGAGANGSYAATGATTWTSGSEVGRNADFYSLDANGNLSLVISVVITANTGTSLTFTGNATGAVFVQVWAPFFTGRVKSFGLKGGSRLTYVMTIRDMADDLVYSVFTGRPHGNVYQTTERIVLGAQTSTTLKDTAQAWTVNQWVGATVTLTKGTGVGQRRTVVSNTSDTLTVAAWTITPSATDTFYSFGYAQLVSVCPVGFIYPYGGVDGGGRPLVRTTPKFNGVMGQFDSTNGWGVLNIDQGTATGIESAVTVTMMAALAPHTVQSIPSGSPSDGSRTMSPQFTGKAICRVTNRNTGAEGDFQVGFLMHDTRIMLTTPIAMITIRSVRALSLRPMSYPLGTVAGSPLANGAQAAAPTAATSAVTTKGWTPSISNQVRGGDVLSFAGHGQRYLVVTAANSDGSGNATLTLKPGLQTALVDNEVITVQQSPGRLALPSAGTPVSFSITVDMRIADGGQSSPIYDSRGRDTGAKHYYPGNLLLINDVHPAQVLRDVLRGWYGRLYQPIYNMSGQPSVFLPPGKNLGEPWRSMPVMDTDPVGDGRHGFNALIADSTFPSFRCIIDKQMPINEFIEKYICQPYGIGYYFDGAGNFVPVDMRQPSAPVPGMVTITDADLKDDIPANWSFDGSAAIAEGLYTIYAEGIVQPISAVLQVGDAFPSITTKMFDLVSYEIFDIALGNPDLSQKQYKIDGKGYRSMPNESGFRNGTGINLFQLPRWGLIQAQITDMANKTVQRPAGNGIATVTFTAMRNSNTANLFPGSFFLLNVAANVDPSSNTRGPTRLCIVTERAEEKAMVKFSAVDWGVAGQANPPTTVGNPANLAGDTAHSQTCAITLNAQNEAAEVWINVTTTSVGSRPADNDPNWMFVETVYVSGWTVTVRGLATGMRVYWRARTNPKRDLSTPGADQAVSALKVPSNWAYPAVDHADLSTMSAPTGLASGSITANSFSVSWTPADTARAVEVWLATPVTEARQRIAQLAPGATSFSFTGLAASSTYRIAIRETDLAGGSAEATIDVTTTSTPPTVAPPVSNKGRRQML